MISVRQAFDRHAPVYDRVFLSTEMRSEVWDMADRLFLPGMRLLDLGCGTGDDAVHFAQRGLNVTAVDISSQMIAQLKAKASDTIRFETADMRTYSPGVRLDGAVSNFGALNCVPELDWIARLPFAEGSHLVLTVMGRFYPLESAVFLLKARPDLAFRRFGWPCEAVVEGVRFNVYYHSLRSMKKALGSRFELIAVKGLRSLMPAPHLDHLRKFSAVRLLEPLDRWLCSHRLTAVHADHYVTVWRYRET